MIVIHKEVGETPLAALERYRTAHPELASVPMTYAGRLDPMAEGELLVLVGDECKDKEKYLGLDKEYEVEIVFGVSTDTYDALGVSTLNQKMNENGAFESKFDRKLELAPSQWTRYVGRFTQEYPPYSSKTFNGRQLHELARIGELPDGMPTKEVEIYAINELSRRTISAAELKREIFSAIDRVKGDFRQEEILACWRRTLSDDGEFRIVKIKVVCSGGTYMRSLAHRVGKDAGVGAFALSIKRTKIYL